MTFPCFFFVFCVLKITGNRVCFREMPNFVENAKKLKNYTSP